MKPIKLNLQPRRSPADRVRAFIDEREILPNRSFEHAIYNASGFDYAPNVPGMRQLALAIVLEFRELYRNDYEPTTLDFLFVENILHDRFLFHPDKPAEVYFDFEEWLWAPREIVPTIYWGTLRRDFVKSTDPVDQKLFQQMARYGVFNKEYELAVYNRHPDAAKFPDSVIFGRLDGDERAVVPKDKFVFLPTFEA